MALERTQECLVLQFATDPVSSGCPASPRFSFALSSGSPAQKIEIWAHCNLSTHHERNRNKRGLGMISLILTFLSHDFPTQARCCFCLFIFGEAWAKADPLLDASSPIVQAIFGCFFCGEEVANYRSYYIMIPNDGGFNGWTPCKLVHPVMRNVVIQWTGKKNRPRRP